MRNELPFDEALVQHLPLPLAQLYRRAHNAKSAQERHHAAYYLWESSLKLLGSVAVVSFLHAGRTPNAHLAEELQNLARPAVGHWWALVRALTLELADTDADFARLKELLLGRARDDLPRVAGLDAALLALRDGRSGGRSTVRLTELFDRLGNYRNTEIGHGAVGQRSTQHYEEMGRALLAGVPQLLERLDVLAGRRLVYLADVRRLGSGAWIVERYGLTAEAPRRLESLERSHDEAAALLPQQVYLAGKSLLPLHPLVAYDFEANEFLFLNARRGKQRVEYLCYTSGRHVDRVEAAAQNAFLAQLLDMPVDDARREEWQARSHGEEAASDSASGGREPPVEARRTLGEFELLSELGRGGMGVVYRAWQPSLGRHVALKSLLKVGDAKAEKRFAREIKALGQVEHPHLIRIFTSDSEGDRWFYAMELVEGATLALVCDRLSASGSSAGEVDLATWRQAVSTACEEARRGETPLGDTVPDATAQPTTVEKESDAARTPAAVRTGRAYVRHVVELVRQTAEAAHALHEKGIIHRDIKPGNIMVGADGASATLMDLGLAQVADETEGRLTKTRQFVGTLRYASPEQVLAVARLDRRSDVYSLGATLWELLALRPLFDATDEMPTPELMQKIQIEEPGRVRRHNPAVPRDLAAVVDKCLQKDPKKRYATAAEMGEELASFLAGEPVKARPVSGTERLWKWVKRRPTQTALLVMTILILVSLAVGGTIFAWQAEQERVEAESHAREQERLRRVADEKRDEANRHRREAVKQKGIVIREKERAEKAEQESRDEAEDLKKERDRTKQLLDRTKQLLANTSVLLADREWDAGHVARARELLDDVPRELRHWEWDYLCRKSQGSYCTLYGHTFDVLGVAFSPGGKRLASASWDETVKVWDAATGGELFTLKGHTSAVRSVAFSPDGKRLGSGSEDKTVKVWDAAMRQEVHSLKGHNAAVLSVAFSPDGKWLASASKDKTVKIWDAAKGKEVLALKGHTDAVSSVAFSPDGKWLASASKDKTVKIWDGAQEFISLKGHNENVTSVAFSPDGKWLASSSEDKTVKIWDAATGKEVLSLKGHTHVVTSVAFSPDGRRLASASEDVTVKMWDAVMGGEARTLKGHTQPVSCVTFSPDGKRVASASGLPWIWHMAEVKIWDAATGRELLTLKGHTHAVTSVAFSPDGRRLASASEDKTVKIWDAATGKEVLSLKGHTHAVTSVAFSPDGRRLASTTGNILDDFGGKSQEIKVWDAVLGREFLTLKRQKHSVLSVAFSPDGRHLASACLDGTVKVWDAATGQEVRTLKVGRGNAFMSVTYSPDGQRLASACFDGMVNVWDTATGQEVLTLKGHSDKVVSVAFSPDGRRLASASWDKSVKLWDAATGQEVLTLKGHSDKVVSVAFSPDGRRLASASDKTVTVWEATKGGGKVLTLRGHTSNVSSVSVNPDGKRLASASWDETVKVWDAATGAEIFTLKGHTNSLNCVAVSPDGRLLASGSGNLLGDKPGEIKVWDAGSRKEVLTLKGHTSPVTTVAFSPDGKMLWSKDTKDIIKAWNLNTGKEESKSGIKPSFPGSGARHPAVPLLAVRKDKTIILIHLEQPDEDELAFRRAKASLDLTWHDRQGAQAVKRGEWFAAAFHCGQLAEHHPWDAKFWTILGLLCDKLRDYRLARSVCDRLLLRDPTLAPIYLRRSAIRMHAKDTRGGWADFLRAVYLSLSDHPDWSDFAYEDTRQGRDAAEKKVWPDAVRHYTLASLWQPHDPRTLQNLAWATLSSGDEDGYRSVCRRLHTRFGNLEGRRDLLTFSVMMGQRSQPLTPAPLVIDRAVQFDAADRAYVIVVTACLLPDSGIDPARLTPLAACAVAVYPSSATFHGMYGAALYRAGKYKEAVEQLTEAVRLQGEASNKWRYLFLAMAYHRLGHAAKARAWRDKAKLEAKASWEERLIYQRLRQEAEKLLQIKAKPK